MEQEILQSVPKEEPKGPSVIEKNLKRIILISGAFLLLLTVIVTGFKLTSTPLFCNACHEMTPEYVTWRASTHNKLACTECHIEPGVEKLVTHKIESLSQVYKHLRKEYLLPIQTPQAVKNEVCNKCHNLTTRVVTPTGDIKIPHDRHLAKAIACVECHSGVAHGKIAIRQQTIDGDFDQWTIAMGEAQMAPRFRTIGMKQCLECHRERKVATTCETCHNKIILPLNHKTSDWIAKGEHGLEAKKSLEKCNRCHFFTKENENISGLDNLSLYARTNTFCFDCHRKKPYSHDESWRANHGSKALGDSRASCLVCHAAKRPRTAEKATNTFCQECHNSKHYSFNRANHPVNLPQDTKISSFCSSCHNVRTCATCHVIPGVSVQHKPAKV
jgi:nitrate/TMAO reductase-like tetraheme cytochrome c subunit